MKNDNIAVSVLCMTYNHEKYIRRCLEGFVSQKTNFNYEILINDDASTDGTRKIIEEFEAKYPNLIKPVYQKKNVYSQNIEIFDEILYPKSSGKYIAICEGDDYWCDNNKLQLQYDFMEAHPECSACFHNTICHDLLGKSKDTTYNYWKEIHFLSPDEVFNEGLVHTTSHFVRRECFLKEKETYKFSFGDYVRKTNYFRYGQLAVLPQVMSVYNSNNVTGLTYDVYNRQSEEEWENAIRKIIEYLNYFNKITNNKYDKFIKEKIQIIDFSILNMSLVRQANNLTVKEFKQRIKIIKNHTYYTKFKNKQKGLAKIKSFAKYNTPFWLWKMLLKLK